jgi:hypothetical protein
MLTWTVDSNALTSEARGLPDPLPGRSTEMAEFLFAVPWEGLPFSCALPLHRAGRRACPATPDLIVELRFALPPEEFPFSCALSVQWAVPQSELATPDLQVELEQVSPTSMTGAALQARADQECVFVLRCADGSAPPCRVRVRRTACILNTSLLKLGESEVLHPQTRAALLWHGWNRYREIVVLKAFTSGKSGSDVLVVRPGLRARNETKTGSESDCALSEQVCGQAWGRCLLVKTAAAHKISAEWDRFHTFLADRLHPFMGRSEALLTAQAGNSETCSSDGSGPSPRATLLSSFLGSNLIQVESLEALVRGPSGIERCLEVLERLFQVTADWHSCFQVETLDKWHRIFRPAATAGAAASWRFLGDFDFRLEADRNRFQKGLYWDVDFVREEHLSRHLLGRPKCPGLLPRLMQLPVRFSLIHGDLHPRNVLVDRANVWLIDFAKTGIGATLADFATLEIYLRLWCLELSAEARHPDEAAAELERLLLDSMVVGEINAEEVRALAESLGAEPNNLMQVTNCITWIRRRAADSGLGRPDRQDYLAVLFLSLLRILRYSYDGRDKTPNYRLLLACFWLVEDVLSRMVGLTPLPRQRLPFRHPHLLTPQWLEAPGAAERVRYFMQHEDGRRALPAVAATRGVLQSYNHHLDVFDHTLLVLDCVEALLDDPLTALLDPSGFSARVLQSLRQQGLPAENSRLRCSEKAALERHPLGPYLAEIERQLSSALDGPARRALKWSALLHDVGKPATRGLNEKGRVNFLGHEVYGLDLVEAQLERLFAAEKSQRQRLGRLIRHHHKHHALVDDFLKKDFLSPLCQALHAGKADDKIMKSLLHNHLGGKAAEDGEDFPLLILHGFADFAAGRGSKSKYTLAQVAEVDLLLLAIWAYRAYLQRRLGVREEAHRCCNKSFDDLNLPQSSRAEFGKRFRSRYIQHVNGPTLAQTQLPPLDDACVRRLADEILRELV